MNPTAVKFGFPDTLVREYRHWLVLLRPAQVTAGSLVLAAKGDARAYGDLPVEAFAEQAEVVADIETALRSAVNFDKINYLMLMMVDPDVHFHVIPRYAGERTLAGISITDAGWPGPPDLASATALDAGQVEAMVGALRPLFARRHGEVDG
ncbi:HIT family protein [Sphingomonas mesophila]|uniref:HIT family protein n=1 Tax=Sphingomonas mesophila TaxID=2303576 RepID=UPI000E58B771|nr:HIT family protein [Sphingomonas mesophila]